MDRARGCQFPTTNAPRSPPPAVVFPPLCRRHPAGMPLAYSPTHAVTHIVRGANVSRIVSGSRRPPQWGDIVMRDLMPLSITNNARPGLWRIVLGVGVMFAVLALLPLLLGEPVYAANPFSPGDLVFGLDSSLDGTLEGKLHHYSPDGSTLLNVLYTNSGAFGESGPCLDAARNLFTTNFEGNSISKFDSNGTLVSPGFSIGLNEHPNSCIFDAAGNLFVGMSDLDGGMGGGRLLKL